MRAAAAIRVGRALGGQFVTWKNRNKRSSKTIECLITPQLRGRLTRWKWEETAKQEMIEVLSSGMPLSNIETHLPELRFEP